MLQEPFVPLTSAFTRSVPIRFPMATPRHRLLPALLQMFNGLIEDRYTQELGYNYAELIMGSQFGFPIVQIECDFNPEPDGDLTLLVERIGRSSLGVAIVCHRDGIERLRPHGHRDDVD